MMLICRSQKKTGVNFNHHLESHHMVDVAQLVEHQIVALVAVGSNPIVHPIVSFYRSRLW